MQQQRLLFYSAKIFDVVESHKQLLRGEAARLSEHELNSDEESLVSRLVSKHSMKVPVLNENAIYVRKKDVDIDYTHNRMMAFQYGSFGDSLILRGIEVTFHVPFTGDSELFDVQPATFTSNPPRGEVFGSELLLIYQTLPDDGTLKNQYQETIQKVKQYLDWLQPTAQQLAIELQQSAREFIAQRKRQHAAAASVIDSLGFPVRSSAPVPEYPSFAEQPQPTRSNKGSKKHIARQKWDVFISHATEDQESFARPLAEELKRRGLEVWYSEFSLTVGDSLRESIDRGLAQSTFGIVILSTHFFEKRWTQQELNGLATREVDKKVILPVWHNITVDQVRQASPMLADRLGVRTEKGIAHVVDELLRAMEMDRQRA